MTDSRHNHSGARFESTLVPVSLPGIGSTQIYGELCVPEGGGSKARTVQLLVHGGTYNHNYFDWPLDPDRYSYVEVALKAGYSTFNVDRLGVGKSSRPPSESVTFDSGADAMHQVIASLRAGDVGGIPFERVIWVGHSLGSLTAWIYSESYRDVDAFVLTGLLHGFKPSFAAMLQDGSHPAMADDKFCDEIHDPGYLTSVPGTHGVAFYYRPGVDQAVIDEDERLKDTYTLSELAKTPVVNDPPSLSPSRTINVPTLLAVGDHDASFFGPPDGRDCTPADVLADERPYYAPETHLQVLVAANSGHNLHLHRSAAETNAWTIDWIDCLS